MEAMSHAIRRRRFLPIPLSRHAATTLAAFAALLQLFGGDGTANLSAADVPPAAGAVATPPGCAVVCVYRVAGSTDRLPASISRGLWWRVCVDQQPACTLAADNFCEFVCPAGSVKVRLLDQRFGRKTPDTFYDPFCYNQTALTLDVRAGEKRYVKLSFPWKWPTDAPELSEASPQEALAALGACKRGGIPADDVLEELARKRKLLLETDRQWERVKAVHTLEAYRSFAASHAGTECAALALRRTQAAVAAPPVNAAANIVDLARAGQLEVRAQGAGIASVGLLVRNLGANPLAVAVPLGTYFAAAAKNVQNMVATADREITLAGNGWQHLEVPVACTNIVRKVPGPRDVLTPDRLPQNAELQRLLPVLERADVRSAIRQAAIWITTDDADCKSLGGLKEVLAKPGTIRIGQSSIGPPEIVRAMQLVTAAGIDITRKRAWGDRPAATVLPPEDADLRNWLTAAGKRGGFFGF
jgi:hypothetical protein